MEGVSMSITKPMIMASGQVGKASVSGTEDRRFESFLASHGIITDKKALKF